MFRNTLVIFLGILVFSTVGQAAPQDVDADTSQDSCEVSAVPTEAQMEEAKEGDLEGANFRGYWHCTAYAEGHGHSWGFDYRDVHYSHAYYGAMNRCERATGHHCHDVHCHYDQH